MLCLVSCAPWAAAPQRGVPQPAPVFAFDSLHGIASWLRVHGREGYIGADVADAMGIARQQGEALVPAWQRGFKNDEVLRIAQVLDNRATDPERDFILFMVQRPDDQVYFYLSTPLGGLRSSPSRARTWCCPWGARKRNCAGSKRSSTGRTGAKHANGSRTHQPDRLPAHRPAGSVGRAAEVSLTSRPSRKGCPKSKPC
jgi:hypothetical protein